MNKADEHANGFLVNGAESPAVGAGLMADGTCVFRVWAPGAKSMDLVDTAGKRSFPMERERPGYWSAAIPGIAQGFTYRYRIDGSAEWPDPASQWQPHGVHGPSAVVDHASYSWGDEAWKGLPPERAIIYEIHTGTFSPEGTFEGVLRRLEHLRTLGITAIEIMPVAEFPGKRNWGYDCVYPYAVHSAYGGVPGLKALVDSCHSMDLGVILDVVYNHLGPEGNYLHLFGPYFTKDKYRTPWGWAINFDDEHSDHVREYFLGNALYWMREFHVDGLRIDAVHSMYDLSACHFLEELSVTVKEFGAETGKRRFLIAESDLNDPKIVRSPDLGGLGVDAQWSDDLHHGVHAVLTGERNGYYADFGSVRHIARALAGGFSYRGEYSRYRKRRFGASPSGVPSTAFVVCSQNHDQIGNRAFGERLVSLSGDDGARLAAATVLLSPMIPHLFMGEEWGETNPFLYFVDFLDFGLNDAVRKGRQREFSFFHPDGAVPDPVSETVYSSSRLDWTKAEGEKGARFFSYYRSLIALRKEHPVFGTLAFDGTLTEEYPRERAVTVTRSHEDRTVAAVLNFGPLPFSARLPFRSEWKLVIASSDRIWGGEGPDAPDTEREKLVVPARSYHAYETQGKRQKS